MGNKPIVPRFDPPVARDERGFLLVNRSLQAPAATVGLGRTSVPVCASKNVLGGSYCV